MAAGAPPSLASSTCDITRSVAVCRCVPTILRVALLLGSGVGSTGVSKGARATTIRSLSSRASASGRMLSPRDVTVRSGSCQACTANRDRRQRALASRFLSSARCSGVRLAEIRLELELARAGRGPPRMCEDERRACVTSASKASWASKGS
eukprot:scaffold170473_cov29-Tisochrysis_lutea.AAC.1